MNLKYNSYRKEIVIAVIVGCYISTSFALEKVVHSISLEISVYDVTQDTVEIDWTSKDISQSSLSNCELVYGPVNDPTQVQVYTGVVPDEHIFKLNGLENNVTYHLHMICYNGIGSKIQSNALQFTTGSKTLPMNYAMPSNTFRGHSSLARDSFYSRDDDYVRTVRSSSVILGAVCGIVGFLIINVTIVMAVRKYSHRQMRRRRIMEIEDREYDEFPYLRGYE